MTDGMAGTMYGSSHEVRGFVSVNGGAREGIHVFSCIRVTKVNSEKAVFPR